MALPLEARPAATGRARLFTFRGPGSALGGLLGAGAGYLASGRNGFYAGLALAAGVILGDVTDRLLVGRGVAPGTLARTGRWIRSGLGVLLFALAAFLLVAFAATRQMIVLMGALVAAAAGAMLIELRPRTEPGRRNSERE
jgi:hypothetical protein